MMAIRLILLLSVMGLSGTDPSGLVKRLGAPKYADREAASAEIEKLGPEALPALRAARTARDAEIRSRAMALVERIENDLMVRSTTVTLNFRDQPLSTVVKSLADAGPGKLVLSPRVGDLRNRRITAIRPKPVSYWEAVDIVAAAGGVELMGGMPLANPGIQSAGSVSLALIPSPPGAASPPVSLAGPFRVSLLNITHNRERTFAGMTSIQPPDLGRVGVVGESEQFFVGLQILAEPRMTVALHGPPRLTAAEDDRGNSLLPSNTAVPGFMQNSGYNQFESIGGAAVQATIGLSFPEQAGLTIKVLRGVLPVTVTARKGDPLVIPLAEARGKSYHIADATLTIHEVKADPKFGPTIIDLSVTRNAPPADPNFNGFGANFAGPRGAPPTQSPLEPVDVRGQPCPQWHVLSQVQTADGLRMSIRVMPAAATGPPTHLRYYEFTRVDTDVDFLFHDVAMP